MICGGISRYNATGPLAGPKNYFNLVFRRARMEGFVLGANNRMLDFVRKLGFRIEFDRDDPAVRVATLDLQPVAAA